jgi:hypothetical protein
VEHSGVEWSVMSRSGANGAPKIEAYEKIKEIFNPRFNLLSGVENYGIIFFSSFHLSFKVPSYKN